jgi:uncharacterized membrane protein (UPF0127 family)
LRKKVIIIIVILAIAALPVGYYVFQPRNTVRIMIDGVVLSVDMARSPAEQQKGLSGRSSLAPDHGMLFVFQSEDYWSFWMNDMKFPLDMIWFNSTRQAVFFEQDAPPCTPAGCPVFTPTVKAIYVLEVNAGFIAAHNVSLGDSFMFITPTLPMVENALPVTLRLNLHAKRNSVIIARWPQGYIDTS